MYVSGIYCGILKVPFEIQHKISYSCMESFVVCWEVKTLEQPDFRARKCFWNAWSYDYCWRAIDSLHRFRPKAFIQNDDDKPWIGSEDQISVKLSWFRFQFVKMFVKTRQI